jgi:hypothetical protein
MSGLSIEARNFDPGFERLICGLSFILFQGAALGCFRYVQFSSIAFTILITIQACDAGLQKPFKQVIHRAQLADSVAAVKRHLQVSNDPVAFKLDVTIGTLRTQSVWWFV